MLINVIMNPMNPIIISYNCNSFKRNLELIDSLSKQSNIMLLQETLIPEHSLNIYNELEEFDFIAAPSVRDESCFYGRSSGGLLVAWRKQLAPFIEPFYFSNRVLGIFLKNDTQRVLLLNIYCPCDYRDANSMVEFKSVLSELRDIYDTEKLNGTDSFVVSGDFNSDPTKGRFFKELHSFVTECSLTFADIECLPSTSHTYIGSNDACSTSFIDHVICSSPCDINNIEIMYGTTFYDHIPMKFSLAFETINDDADSVDDLVGDSLFLPWSSLNEEDIDAYSFCLENLCDQFELLECRSVFCSNPRHFDVLDSCYDRLIDSVMSTSSFLLCSRSTDGFRCVPGWNEYCRELYAASRESYLFWISSGKQRNGEAFELMKENRKRFKDSLKFCRDNEMKLRRNKLAAAFSLKNKNSFWKRVKSLNTKQSKPSTCVDEKTSVREINDVFAEKYKKILDDPRTQTVPEGLDRDLEDAKVSRQIGSCMVFRHVVDASIEI